jgi:predicted alpha/beta hydrolase family esterase
MKKQIIFIHGGDVFKTYKDYLVFLYKYKINPLSPRRDKWQDYLQKNLGSKYEVLMPQMPNALNARYLEWKIYFEKLLPTLNKEIILIGKSLGGIFLAKYLSTNKITNKIKALFLVAAPFDDKDCEEALFDFNFTKKELKNLSSLSKQCKSINVFQSYDDTVVPFVDFLKYKKSLPKANFYALKNYGHFDTKKFPEISK